MASKIKKVSMVNTKKELIEAYNNLVEQLKSQEELQLQPKKIAEEKNKKETLAKIENISLNGIAKQITDLKSSINSSLNDVESKLETEVKKFENIQKAIDVKETELKEIFEIEKSAHSLAALIETQNEKKIEFEEDIENQKATTLKEIEKLKSDWENEKQQHEEVIKERDQKLKKDFERQKEELEYNFEREKKIKFDKLEDELNKKEKDFNNRIEATEEDIKKRESILAEKEKHLANLENRISRFEEEINAHVSKAVEGTREQLKSEYESKIESLKNDFAGQKNVLSTKIDSYQNTVQEQKKKIDELSRKLDEAYSKVQDVAVRTIESSSNAKAFGELQKAFTEKFSGKSKED